ncbi:uncharacterized protein CIMG_10613 [Coccidioides immitis RS]|uniref:Uncharacterized protein n=1 Tax=Coccidioides immitis (strain RS) TaxID=246410 RepID=A0A0D8JSL1_COCIM|nr:uncharacterized protein CIMG_10613 [Coccidioides immitis RS]KJF60272.1 hypothetical protein CIMG_10613 [Coccidioides immitis RS]
MWQVSLTHRDYTGWDIRASILQPAALSTLLCIGGVIEIEVLLARCNRSYRSRNRKQFKADSINPKQYSRKCAAQPGRHLPNIEAQTNGLGFWIRPDDERNCGSEGEVTSGWWIEEFGPQSLTHDRMRERYRRTRTSWMEKRREYGQREADTGANAQRQGLWPMRYGQFQLSLQSAKQDSDQIGKVAIQYGVMMTRFLLRILVSDTNEFVELQRGEEDREFQIQIWNSGPLL